MAAISIVGNKYSERNFCAARLIFFLVVLCCGAGCGFHRYWSFVPEDRASDNRIPCWDITVSIDHLLLAKPDSLRRFILEVKGKSKCKQIKTMVGYDSVGISKIFADNRTETEYYQFSENVAKPRVHLSEIKILKPFGEVPDKIKCILYCTILDVHTAEIRKTRLVWELFFKERKSFWLGT